MLDRAAGAGLGDGVERLADRAVADRVDRDLEAVLGGAARAGSRSSSGVWLGWPCGKPERRRAGVGLAAPGGAGVERAVADDLERPHPGPVVAAGQHVTGAQAALDDGVQPVGVRRDPDPQQVAAGLPAGDPLVGAAAELEVGDADDAERRGLLLGAQERVGAGAVVAEDRHQPGVRREPLALGHHPLAERDGEGHQRDPVEPGVVAVAGDQHDRLLGPDLVEHRDDRVDRPVGGPVPPADDRLVGPGLEPLPDRGERRSADRTPVRSSRALDRLHWVRWTCWSHSPGSSHRPSASTSGRPSAASPGATSVTTPSITRTSTGASGVPLPSRSARRASRRRKLVMAPRYRVDLAEPVGLEEQPRLVLTPGVDEPVERGVAEQRDPTVSQLDHLEVGHLAVPVGLHGEVDHGRCGDAVGLRGAGVLVHAAEVTRGGACPNVSRAPGGRRPRWRRPQERYDVRTSRRAGPRRAAPGRRGGRGRPCPDRRWTRPGPRAG